MARTSRLMRSLALVVFLALAGGLVWLAAPEGSRQLRARVVKTYPHDPQAYTQGLLYRNGHLFESTGRNGRSSIRKVSLETGEVQARKDLDYQYFAEGLAFDGEHLVQLTWQSGKAFLYDEDLAPKGEFTYRGEGWGLTFDGRNLVVSDGSDELFFVEPKTFKVVRSVHVRDRGTPVTRLNELEYVKGKVFANVWKTDSIAVIDPDSGDVEQWIDVSGVFDYRRNVRDPEGVPNGIAWDPEGERLFLTGKLWPHLYEVVLEEVPEHE